MHPILITLNKDVILSFTFIAVFIVSSMLTYFFWFYPGKSRFAFILKLSQKDNSSVYRILRIAAAGISFSGFLLILLAVLSANTVRLDTYSALFTAGIIIGGMLLYFRLKRHNINAADFLLFFAVVVLSAIIGARLFFALFEFGTENIPPPLAFFHYPMIFFSRDGGFVIYGGLILGTIGGLYYTRKKGLPTGLIADAGISSLFLGIFFGRLGCMFNGCCFGERCGNSNLFGVKWNAFKPGTGAFDFHYNSIEYNIINTQAVSAVFALFMFLLFSWLYYKQFPKLKNILFPAGAICYALFRFVIEFFRADNPAIFLHMTISQLISILIFITSALIIAIKRKNER